MAEGEDGESRSFTGLDEGEFHEAFRVFSNDSDELSNSSLIPFLRSLGIRKGAVEDAIVAEVKTRELHTINERTLRKAVAQHAYSLDDSSDPWPSHDDVLQAFRVFDSESVGFIKVTLLKRFLLQAQLDADDTVLERLIRENCQIDGDDLINYNDFVENLKKRHEDLRFDEEDQ